MSRADIRTTERLHAAQLRGVTVEVGLPVRVESLGPLQLLRAAAARRQR